MKPENKRQLLLWVVALLLAATSVVSYMGKDVVAQKLRRPLDKLDLRFGVWRAVGPDVVLDQATMKLLKPNDYLLREYVDPSGNNIALFVVYFGLQEEGRIIHSPRHCLPGAGWQIQKRNQITLNGTSSPWKVNHLILSNELEKLSVLYWYQGRGRVESNEYIERLRLLWDGLTTKRSDGALVRLTMLTGNDHQKSLKYQLDIAKELIPALDKILPDTK